MNVMKILARVTLATLAFSGLCAAEETALTTVVYDLSALGQADVGEDVELHVLPYAGEEERDQPEPSDGLDEAVFSLLVDTLYPGEFQYEGREINLIGDGQLFVTAPTAVHQGIRTLVDYLDQATHRHAQVRWEIFAVTQPLDDVSSESLEDRVTKGSARLIHSQTERVPVGQTVLRTAESTHQMIAGWAVELAQTSVSHAPELRNLIGGTTLLIRVEDILGSDSQRVRLVQQVVGSPTLIQKAIHLGARVFLDDKTVTAGNQRLIDLYRTDATTMAGTSVLNKGQAVEMAAWCESLSGVSGLVTRLTLEQVDAAPAPVQLAGSELRLLDLSAFFWGGLTGPEFSSSVMQNRKGVFSENDRDEEADLLTFPPESDGWDLTVAPVTENLVWEHDGASFSEQNWMLLAAEPAALAACVETLTSRQTNSRSVLLEWGLDDEQGQPIAGGQMQVEQHSDSAALVGEALSYLHGWDIDVATGSHGREITPLEAFDGLWLVAHANGRGGVQLALTRNHLASLTEEPLDEYGSDGFERAVFESADVSLHVSADGQRHQLTSLSTSQGQATFWAKPTLR